MVGTIEISTPEFYIGKLSPRKYFHYLNIGKLNFYKVYEQDTGLKKAIDDQVEDHNIVLADKFVFDDDSITNSTKLLDALGGDQYPQESELDDCHKIELKSPAYSLFNTKTYKLTSPNGQMTFFCHSKETIVKWKERHPKQDQLRIVRLDKVTKLIDAPSQYNLESICTSNRYLVIPNNHYISPDSVLSFKIEDILHSQYDDNTYISERHNVNDLINQLKSKILKDGWVEDLDLFMQPSYFLNIIIKGNKVKFIKDLNN